MARRRLNCARKAPADLQAADAVVPSVVRALIRRIVDGVAVGQKYHLRVVFSDATTHDTTRLGDPDVTIVFRNRRAERRMVLGGMFEFLEAYFDGDIDIVGEQGLRKLVNIGYRTTFGRFEHPLTVVKRMVLEWRQNNKDLAQAKRNATFHYGLPTEFFRLVLGETLGYSEGFWRQDTQSLDEAQHNNFDMICRKLHLRPGHKLVEVGPGWGYMSMLAAQKYGAEVTSYGLVGSQNEWRQNNKDLAQAKRNATFHYGLPTEFFRLVLGETLGYSEGFWRQDTQSLDEAQHNNFDMICRKLHLRPGHKLVEVGPGWGYMSMLAAQKYGAEVTSYGLVGSQNDAMRMMMKARNFDGKLTLVEKDHRELADEPDRYDRFVSIGVHEHAGRDCNEQWIASIARGLRPGGVGLISATFNMKQRPTNYCAIKHIFPGGYIPSLAQTLIFMEKHGLNVTAIDNLSYHYHQTVEQWQRNFESHWERILLIDPQRFNEKFRRTWLFYLGGAAETFEAAREIINCYHITFCKGHFSGAAP